MSRDSKTMMDRMNAENPDKVLFTNPSSDPALAGISLSDAMKTPITGTQFNVGNYRCRYGQALDADNRPTGENCVWLWNGHYWGLLVRDCTDLESAQYSAAQELIGNIKAATL